MGSMKEHNQSPHCLSSAKILRLVTSNRTVKFIFIVALLLLRRKVSEGTEANRDVRADCFFVYPVIHDNDESEKYQHGISARR